MTTKLLGVITRPGTTRQNKTGAWGLRLPEFDWDKCTGCNTCEVLCPEGCIFHLERKHYQADAEYCKGCGICAEECPAKGITMKMKESG